MIYQEELAFATKFAQEAGDIMKRYVRSDEAIEIKADDSPVTVADKAINQLLIEHVQEQFSSDGVLGEEQSWHQERGRLWVCDPIDGTVAYIMRVPTSMFSLALVEKGKPVLAVAYNPWVNELYHAVINQGSYRNNQPIEVSSKEWGQSIHIASSSKSFLDDSKLKVQLAKQGVYVHEFQGGVCKGCLIAEGGIEGRIFLHNGAHDIAALKLLIEEAGGRVTDLEGNEQPYNQAINGAVLSNGKIHDKLLALVRDHK